MSDLSKTFGVNIDITKDIENLAVEAGKETIADELKANGLPTTTLGLLKYLENKLLDALKASLRPKSGILYALAAKVVTDLFALVNPKVPNIQL
jgi:hypothetical protein